MVRASRLDDISELDWWGSPQSLGHLHIDLPTFSQWLLLLPSLLALVLSVPVVQVTSRTGSQLPFLNTLMPMSTWYVFDVFGEFDD